LTVAKGECCEEFLREVFGFSKGLFAVNPSTAELHEA